MNRISIDPITRFEGHGKIDIFLTDEGDVANVYLQIPELRGFERRRNSNWLWLGIGLGVTAATVLAVALSLAFRSEEFTIGDINVEGW